MTQPWQVRVQLLAEQIVPERAPGLATAYANDDLFANTAIAELTTDHLLSRRKKGAACCCQVAR